MPGPDKGRGPAGNRKSMLRPRDPQETRRTRTSRKEREEESDGELAGRHVVVTGGGRGSARRSRSDSRRKVRRYSLLAPNLEGSSRWQPRLGAGRALLRHPRPRAGVDAAFAPRPPARGPIHALVANSGIGGGNADGPDDRFEEIVQTNLFGGYWCVRAAVRHLAPGPERRDVVVIASILARIAVPGYTGYSASKAGLLGLTRSFSAELAPAGVQVNAICPDGSRRTWPGWGSTRSSPPPA